MLDSSFAWITICPLIIRPCPSNADAMVFRPMSLFLSLRNHVAPALEHPRQMITRVWKKELGPDTQPASVTDYTEALNKFTKAATEFMEYARLLAEARNAYQLRHKEIELAQLRREIDSLKLVISLLIEDSDVCQTENQYRGVAAPLL